MTSTVDEEIIRKRLLLDGEGAGDDRKLTMILKSFLKVILIPDNLTGKPDAATVPVDGPVTFLKCIVRLNLIGFSYFEPYLQKLGFPSNSTNVWWTMNLRLFSPTAGWH